MVVEDDQGRRNRENVAARHRRNTNAQRMREARAIQRREREERDRARAALENREENERQIRAEYKDQEVTDLKDLPRLGSVITLAIIIGSRTTLGDTMALNAANLMLREARELFDPEHVWNNQIGNHFQNYHDHRFVFLYIFLNFFNIFYIYMFK